MKKRRYLRTKTVGANDKTEAKGVHLYIHHFKDKDNRVKEEDSRHQITNHQHLISATRLTKLTQCTLAAIMGSKN